MKKQKRVSVKSVKGFDLESFLVKTLGKEYSKVLKTAGIVGIIGLLFAPAIKDLIKMLNRRVSKLFKDEDYD